MAHGRPKTDERIVESENEFMLQSRILAGQLGYGVKVVCQQKRQSRCPSTGFQVVHGTCG
jgi:hypothetical protein